MATEWGWGAAGEAGCGRVVKYLLVLSSLFLTRKALVAFE